MCAEKERGCENVLSALMGSWKKLGVGWRWRELRQGDVELRKGRKDEERMSINRIGIGVN